MSESMAAEISIGGPVPYRLIGRLCLAIAEENVALDWGDATFLPVSAEVLLKARRQEGKIKVLKLYADEVRWGQFEILEEFLHQHQISYQRRSDGKYEYDPELIEYRPSTGVVKFQSSHDGHPVVPLVRFRAATSAMEEAIDLLGKRQPQRARQRLASVIKGLYCDMPREVPPLETFEIVKGGRRAFRT